MQDFQNLDRLEWHHRYLAQAGWTSHLRKYVFKNIAPRADAPILEIGSGTGAIMEALIDEGYRHVFGVDLDYPNAIFAKTQRPSINQVLGDGHQLPFAESQFTVSLCHYLLMWAANPGQVLAEMQRVTHSGGWVLALAEPDYQARIDYPPPLDFLGTLQTDALQTQGVDIRIGRKLRRLFVEAGLIEVKAGIMGAEWHDTALLTNDPTEWGMFKADLEDRLNHTELSELMWNEQEAQKKGERVLFIPTFYAFGKVP